MLPFTTFTRLTLVGFLVVLNTSCTVEENIDVCPDGIVPLVSFSDNFEDAKIEYHTPDGIGLLNQPRFDSQGVANLWNINAEIDINDKNAVTITDTGIDGVGAARLGDHAVKLLVEPTDNIGDGNRSEISYRQQSTVACSEGYYSWSFKLDPTYVEDGNFQTIGQFHAQPLPGYDFDSVLVPNPAFMDYNQGEIRFVVRPPPDYQGEVIASQAISLDTWVDLIFHVKWAESSEGFVEAWIRTDPSNEYIRLTQFNSQTGDYKIYGPTIESAAGNYVKLGLYRSLANVSTTGIVYFDEFHIGNSLAEVALGSPPVP